MVNCCCVNGCRNESYPGSPFSFHSFPKNEQQKLKWINFLSAPVKKSYVICSAHFKTEDYNYAGSIKGRLKPEAVPSICFPMVQLVPSRNQELNLNTMRLVDPELEQELEQELKQELEQELEQELDQELEPAPMRILEHSHHQPSIFPNSSFSLTQENPGSACIKLKFSVSTQTTFTCSTPREKQFKREIKILQQRLKRRSETIKKLKSLLKKYKKQCDDNATDITSQLSLFF